MENIMFSVKVCSFVLASILALSFAFAQDTSSGYNPEDDVTITVDNPVTNSVAETLNVGKIGDTAFNAQEGVHKAVEGSTGKSVSHYYVKVCLGSSCVPVDPFKFSK
jgi:hypothetical protein